MSKSWITMWLFCAMAAATASGEDVTCGITVYLDYDPRVPQATVYRATRKSGRIFARIEVPVKFHNADRFKPDTRSGLELDMYIGMEIPAKTSTTTLALSHPFRTDGRIHVFYSRIRQYEPSEWRDALLAYITAHEITHVLEGMEKHSSTGVMKEVWNRDDFRTIQADTLEFDPSDIALIRSGIERRLALSSANLTSIHRESIKTCKIERRSCFGGRFAQLPVSKTAPARLASRSLEVLVPARRVVEALDRGEAGALDLVWGHGPSCRFWLFGGLAFDVLADLMYAKGYAPIGRNVNPAPPNHRARRA